MVYLNRWRYNPEWITATSGHKAFGNNILVSVYITTKRYNEAIQYALKAMDDEPYCCGNWILSLRDNICSTFKDIEELLEDHSFARVHRYYLVNLNEVEKYVKGEGGYW